MSKSTTQSESALRTDQSQKKQNNKPKKKKPIICYDCKELGHKRPDCPLKKKKPTEEKSLVALGIETLNTQERLLKHETYIFLRNSFKSLKENSDSEQVHIYNPILTLTNNVEIQNEPSTSTSGIESRVGVDESCSTSNNVDQSELCLLRGDDNEDVRDVETIVSSDVQTPIEPEASSLQNESRYPSRVRKPPDYFFV
ncbi:hypothetical protein ACJJTC_002335 [Scirpophaga incertulas]